MAWIIASIVLVGISLGSLVFYRVPFVRTKESNQSFPNISIIIPARNEEQTLPRLLASIQNQTVQPLEVIVVDDDSTDDTARIATTHGATVLSRGEEANGKAAACFTGAQKATGEWLLFLDADTFFTRTTSLEAILQTFDANGRTGIVSLQPFHVVTKLYEYFSFVFNVVIMAGLNAFSIWGEKFKPSGAFGPCIICTKEEYVNVGGHDGMNMGILDDIALAQRFKRAGYQRKLYGGKGTLSFVMFPVGFRQLVEGWSKDFATASTHTNPLIRLFVMGWVAGGSIGFFLFVFLPTPVALILYALYGFQSLRFARRVGSFPTWIFLVYPLLYLFFLVVFLWSLIQTHILKSVNWKGRKVRL